MQGQLVPVTRTAVMHSSDRTEPPTIVARTGKAAAFAYAEFFGAEIESAHTFRAYRHAVDQCLAWCASRGVMLQEISPALLGEYLRKLPGSKPTKSLSGKFLKEKEEL